MCVGYAHSLTHTNACMHTHPPHTSHIPYLPTLDVGEDGAEVRTELEVMEDVATDSTAKLMNGGRE